MRRKYDDISNSDLAKIIDDWVKGEKYRALMKRRLIDKVSLEQLAEEFDFSVSHVKRIISTYEDLIYHHIYFF